MNRKEATDNLVEEVENCFGTYGKDGPMRILFNKYNAFITAKDEKCDYCDKWSRNMRWVACPECGRPFDVAKDAPNTVKENLKKVEEFVYGKPKIDDVGQVLHQAREQREEILRAFMAKYGFEPDEAVQVEQQDFGMIRWWVEKKVKGKATIEPLPDTIPAHLFVTEVQVKLNEVIAYLKKEAK